VTTCPQCHSVIDAGDEFCGDCGTRVAGAVAISPTTVMQDPAAAFPAPPPGDERSQAGTQPWSTEKPEPARASVVSSRPQDSELLGQAAPNEFYVGHRLQYKDSQAENLDPLSFRFIAAISLHCFLLWIVWLVGAIVLGIAVLVLGPLGIVLEVVWWLAVGVVVWWVPILSSLSEWKFTLDDKGGTAPAVFGHICAVLERRQTPTTKLGIKRLKLGGSATRDYLYVQDGIFRAYVSCFAYGEDLYVGWTLWWRLSLVRWWLTMWRRWFQSLTLRGSELYNVHRYDYAKALREAIHSSTREGLDVATGLVVASPGSGTFGSDLAIEEISISQDKLDSGADRFLTKFEDGRQ
jgi:hypothetical protein